MSQRRGSDQRRSYRTTIGDEFTVNIIRGEDTLGTTLQDLAARGCSLTYNPQDAGAEDIQEQTVLNLVFARQGRQPIRVEGEVVQKEMQESPEGARVRVGISFLKIEELYEQLDADVWPFFNRRRAYRVVFGTEEEPIQLKVKGYNRNRRLEGPMYDLSLGGCSLEVPPDVLVLLVPRSIVQLRFRPPGVTWEATVRGYVVHRLPGKLANRVGFAFSPEKGDRWPRTEDALLDYVMEVQRKALSMGDD